MEKVRFFIALVIGKLVSLVTNISQSNSDLPGRVALAICPNFLAQVQKPDKLICVTGSNGKTTAANLISDCIKAMEIEVLSNGTGSNRATGIASCLLRGVNLLGTEKYSTGVIEVDERSVGDIFTYMAPTYLLITSLARDSIIRNGHPEYIQQLLTHYLPQSTKLIINADDLMSVGVAQYNPRKYFGIDKMEGDKKYNTNLIDDSAICPNCHKRLSYEYNRYSNLGKAYCAECGYKAPEYDYEAEILSRIDNSNPKIGPVTKKIIRISTDKKEGEFPVIHDSVFNIYNEVAAISTLLEMGFRFVDIKRALDMMTVSSSRYNVTEQGDIKVISLLCKERNAYATTRLFEYIVNQSGDKEIILMNNSLDDAKHWSENISWYYDCDFEILNDESIRRIVVYGARAYDLKLRMLLAGIPEDRIVCVADVKDAPQNLEYYDNGSIFVLYGRESARLGKDVEKRVLEIAASIQGGVPIESEDKPHQMNLFRRKKEIDEGIKHGPGWEEE